MTQELTGKEVADKIHEGLRARIAALAEAGVVPRLALVRMGERPDDLSYERTAIKRADALGIETVTCVLDGSAAQADIEGLIESINQDASLHACLLFRPLPSHIDEQAVCDALSPDKDIDAVSLLSLAGVFTDADSGFAPCTAAACREVLDFYGIALEGKKVAVVGRSLVVGKPLAMMLLRRNATVTLCHSRTADLPAVCQDADIVVCATGRAKAFGKAYFKAGQVVLDVGINFDEEGRLCGDVDFEAVAPLVAAITPVPRGIGAVTTSVLMAHAVAAAELAGKTG
ncbi:MAG: bifunctional 5,10-methylenetetrahydrofolate dehydrogenase/5,10-methenyltetrahydrofolate cyclohydrolase [Coriobacteriaceae bacterium]|jgi:methylenetetrahydrofolate dehydrogenase (NADP+)/methenyltetrahydrofolate cyclohydrolase|nr:bifunctional 5,10-methylenetetrahydrofolate dehydrogenase/5,10-methenyltetrahydrofolate cyclohydrolase [Coriobacteriaceae bacterium]